MRYVTRVPAEQLRSVAQRYRSALDRTHGPRAAGGVCWSSPVARREGGLKAAESAAARRGRLEAVLFLAREPLNSRKLAQHARLADGTEARTLVRQLNRLYDETGRAFRVEEVAGGFQLLTRRQFASWLRRLEHVAAPVRLSAPAMETLAVVAYRQPVLRAEIEAVRGVNCGEILRQLMERDLVRIGGRSEELGRPYLYATTKRFLQLFGLQNLDDLPRAEALRDISGSSNVMNEFLNALRSNDEALVEQEKSEVSVTSPIQLPVDELWNVKSPATTIAPQGSRGHEEAYGDDFEDEDEDLEEEDDEEDDDEEDLEDEEDDDEFEDGFEEEEWEEVEDDEVEDDDVDDEEWDDDEDEDWEDELEEEDEEFGDDYDEEDEEEEEEEEADNDRWD